jgi:hypothetical protein
MLVAVAFGGALVSALPAGAQELPPPTSQAGALARYWAIDRLFINGGESIVQKPILQNRLLAKAQADECFDGIGNPYPPIEIVNGEPFCAQGVEKVNQGYVWGLTRQGNSLWFGTVANTLCSVEAGYLEQTEPRQDPYSICEFGQAIGKRGDWRPPRIYRYNLETSTLTDLTPLGGALLQRTSGVRSAGSINGIVFLAGPGSGGINLFAFDASTGGLLGSTTLTAYNDIRSWTTVNGTLYTAVGTPLAVAGQRAGAVLRWRGVKSTIASELFAFEEVGDLDTMGASIALNEGRLYVTTWPSTLPDGSDLRYAGLYRGPLIPADGLTSKHRPLWTKIWTATDYEIDPLAARGYGGGALASFDDRLFWGTMHVPMSTTTRAFNAAEAGTMNFDANLDGTLDQSETMATILGTHRALAIFSIKKPESRKVNVELVYGEYYLPKYDPEARSYTIAYDEAHMNGLHKAPKFGGSGFGNFFNAYTWTMGIHGGDLYIGTFDWSNIARINMQRSAGQEISMTPLQIPQLPGVFGSMLPVEGADLLRITNRAGKAVAERLDGVGNFTSYGVRTMVIDGDTMYLGMANPMNLHPQGGWELIEMKPAPR